MHVHVHVDVDNMYIPVLYVLAVISYLHLAGVPPSSLALNFLLPPLSLHERYKIIEPCNDTKPKVLCAQHYNLLFVMTGRGVTSTRQRRHLPPLFWQVMVNI